MRLIKHALGILLACSMAVATQAQIYETQDAEGNPVFSDVPTQQAEKVELQQNNIADSVEPRPSEPAAPPAKDKSSPPRSEPSVTVIGGNDDLEDLREDLGEEVRQDRMHEAVREHKDGGPVTAQPVPRAHPHRGGGHR